MKKLLKKFKKGYRKIKTSHLNNKNVILKNNEKNEKQLSEKLCKKYLKFLKNYIKKGKFSEKY